MAKLSAGFTVGQVAKLFGVSPRTVANWMDSGKIKGHRLPQRGPVAGHRRILREHVVELMRRQGVSLSRLEELDHGKLTEEQRSRLLAPSWEGCA